MRWPKLVRNARIPIELTLDIEAIDEDGAPVVGASFIGLCSYSSTSKRLRVAHETYVQVSAEVLIDGDVAPGVVEVSTGKAKVFGHERNIIAGSKCRNPDGTVNYTRLWLS